MTLSAPRFAAAALAATLMLGAGLAEAKPLSRMLAQTGLSPEDITMLSQATEALFRPAPKTGARQDWSNPESGSVGNVRIMAIEGQCATLRHQFRPGSANRTEQIETLRCRDAEGRWVAE